MKAKIFALTALLAVLPAPSVNAQSVFYSPVFNMPLQPAPSPCNGGFYWVMPDGRVFGPNYCLTPPFTPISGFNSTIVGQELFAKMHKEAVTGKTDGKGGSSGPGQPAKQFGFSGYNLDYSDPDTFQKFDATAPMANGYVPFNMPPPSLPNYGNGPMPTPRYANYPNYQAMAYPNQGAYWQSPITQAQAQYQQPNYPPAWPYPQAMPYPQGQPMPYNFGYANYPSMSYPAMPGYGTRTANYTMPQTCYPPLPNPSFVAPPCPGPCPPCCNSINPLARSPRDFWMYTEVQEDKAAQARLPLRVP
jgi:hypothetical protein